jgi:hypothetical protein
MIQRVDRLAAGRRWACAFSTAGVVLLAPAICAATTIQISPSPKTVTVGDTFTVDVDIADATNLYAFQLGLTFNPAVLQLVSDTEGALLPSGGTTANQASPVPPVFPDLGGTIDNIGGSLTGAFDSLVGNIPGVTGAGTLGVLQFSALASGNSAISLILINDATLLFTLSPANVACFQTGDPTCDPGPDSLTVDQHVDGQVIVQAPAGGPTVPEPASLVLVGTGLVAAWRARRRSGV